MRAWIVNQYAVPPSQPGITRHHALAAALIGMGHDVTLVAGSFDHVTRRETRLAPGEAARLEAVEGVPYLWLRTPPYPGNGAARAWNMAMFAARTWAGHAMRGMPRPDVVVGSSPHLFGALAAERLAARLGRPFVLEVRDLWPQTLVDLGGVPPGHPAVRGLALIERWLYRRADRIVTLLPGAAEAIAARGGDRARVRWVPNGVAVADVPVPPPPPERPRMVFMYAGAHGLANGLDVVLDAAKLLAERGLADRAEIRLVGDGPEKARLMARARAEGIAHVAFLDAVPKRAVYATLAEADAFLLSLKPSPVFRWGVSPNKLFDYLALARPVLFGVETPHDPVAEAGAGWTVRPGDPAALADAMAACLATDAAARRAMGLRGRAWAERHHDTAGLARRFEAALLAAAGKEEADVRDRAHAA